MAQGKNGRRVRHARLLIALLLVIGGAAVWLLDDERVEVVHPIRGPATQAVYATGIVEYAVMFPIVPRSAARLVELKVDERDAVRRGDMLARLEDEDLRSTVAELQARERFTRDAYERNAALRRQKAVSEETFERAKWEWEAAKAAVDRAEVQASFMVLTAPADGTVIRRDGEVGELIGPEHALVWLATDSKLRVTAEVDEEDISLVKVGQAALIRADALPGEILHGSVSGITPKGDPVGRSFRVRIDLAAESELRAGMTAEVNIIIRESTNAVLLPATAVIRDRVWTVSDGRLMERKITVGARGKDIIEAKDGVTPDDLVVVRPEPTFRGGEPVDYVIR